MLVVSFLRIRGMLILFARPGPALAASRVKARDQPLQSELCLWGVTSSWRAESRYCQPIGCCIEGGNHRPLSRYVE